jgi:hypothetical protein
VSELASTLFGMPLVLDADDVRRVQRVATEAWELQAGRPPAEIEEDLEALASWFHPKLRGATLRAKLGDLEPLTLPPSGVPPLVLLPCGEGRGLLTPEGRAWLEVSTKPRSRTNGQLVYSAEQGRTLEARLLVLYRDWSRHRLQDVIEKQTGGGSPMLPTAVALVLLLLVNGSLEKGRAIRRVRAPEAQARIDGVVADVIGAFADSLARPSSRGRSPEQFSLWSGYPLTEARRRLAGLLILDPEEGAIYLAPGSEERVVDFLAQDLSRRRGLGVERLEKAFDALVDTYRRRLPDLSALGSGFERVGRTEALRERLSQAVAGTP